jgi:hypothetical protein
MQDQIQLHAGVHGIGICPAPFPFPRGVRAAFGNRGNLEPPTPEADVSNTIDKALS